jgi:DNA polymerase-3 subunit epsilon
MKWFARTPLEAVRWVVIDCETSGLNMHRDRLLSVGAVAVREGRLDLRDSFGALVQQAVPSVRDNIVIHGIGGDAQLSGRPLSEVVQDLAAYVRDGVPVGFHAAFDAMILRRHGLRLGRPWLDLATLSPVLFPEQAPSQSSLDHWLREFGIPPQARHDALGDAFATAQLLLVILAQARREGIKTLEALARTARAGRWLASGG